MAFRQNLFDILLFIVFLQLVRLFDILLDYPEFFIQVIDLLLGITVGFIPFRALLVDILLFGFDLIFQVLQFLQRIIVCRTGLPCQLFHGILYLQDAFISLNDITGFFLMFFVLKDVMIVFLGRFKVIAVGFEVYHMGVISQGMNDCLFDKAGIQRRVQKYVTNGSWNILIGLAFQQAITPHLPLSSENNIQKLRVGHLLFYFYAFGKIVFDHRLFINGFPVVDKHIAVIGPVDKAKHQPVLTPLQPHAESPFLAIHFINDVGINIGEVIFGKRFLFFGNPQAPAISRIEKKNSPQHRAFTHTLRSDKVNVTVQPEFLVRYRCAIHEYDFT